jgi:hypothetical protein
MLPILPNGLHNACEALEGPFDEDMHQYPSSGASGTECRRATAFFINFAFGGPDCLNANLSELDR